MALIVGGWRGEVEVVMLLLFVALLSIAYENQYGSTASIFYVISNESLMVVTEKQIDTKGIQKIDAKITDTKVRRSKAKLQE